MLNCLQRLILKLRFHASPAARFSSFVIPVETFTSPCNFLRSKKLLRERASPSGEFSCTFASRLWKSFDKPAQQNVATRTHLAVRRLSYAFAPRLRKPFDKPASLQYYKFRILKSRSASRLWSFFAISWRLS